MSSEVRILAGVTHDPEPPAHVVMMLGALQRQEDRLQTVLRGVIGPSTTLDALGLDLTLRCAESRSPGLQVVVSEGAYVYPLAHANAGWGSLLSSTTTANVMLVRREPDGRRSVIGESEVRTDPHRPALNAKTMADAATLLLTQPRLRLCQPRPLAADAAMNCPRIDVSAKARRALGRIRRGVVRRLLFWPRHRREQWSIAVLPRSTVTHGAPIAWPAVRWLAPPPAGFIADPFLAEHDGKLLLFYEALEFEENKGTLWVAELDTETPALRAPREVLNQPFHLSFPNVFKVDGQWYMLPEQGRSGKTVLYRATRFPDEWVQHAVLLDDLPGIDPVLLQRDGRWWLFVTIGMSPLNESNLLVFSSDRLEGPFQPHPMNPVHIGLKGSRMAGQVFADGDRLIRPAQDGRTGYGEGVVLFEITRLDVSHYEEREICTLPPPRGTMWGSGFHSYVQCGDWVAIDGKRFSVPDAPLR